ncbi:MAG: hypothetical protein JNK74_03225 [Candidatus Hydrogenedentes bacterium]|nr:hypothetical protein [Candidatus Hydrogenedentota bacterium]
MNVEQKRTEISALLLVEEALQLLLRTGVVAASLYVMGTLPFVVAAVYYWSAMTHSPDAHAFASTGALMLALLFVVMKTFQSRFAQHLRATLVDGELTPWTFGQFFRTLCRQALIHATVIVVYPIGMVTLIPMAYSIAWYQNATLLDDGGAGGVRQLARDALGQAILWPRQNHALLWLCSPLMVVGGGIVYLVTFPVLDGLQQGLDQLSFFMSLGTFYGILFLIAMLPLSPVATTLAMGIGATVFFGIEFFHILTGADTLYARNPGALADNTVFTAMICGLTYLALDPVLKAAYALRCHNGFSQKTGVDLQVSLQRIRSQRALRAATALLVIAFGAGLPGYAQEAQPETSPPAASLDSALRQELEEARYTWRMPREAAPDAELPWLLQALDDFVQDLRDRAKAIMDWVKDKWRDFRDWLSGDDSEAPQKGFFSGFSPSLRILTVVIGVVLVLLTLYLVWISYRQRPPEELVAIAPLEANAPDLEDEATTAADLPEDEWYRLAQELANSGDYRLATRALFFSILATLARHEAIRIARFKSNMDYQQELRRRESSLGEAPALFSRLALLYESVWYGEHEANVAMLNQMHDHQERLRHAVE